jgi:serine/threonine protein kinase/dipeptidyl aminopeptidase/acylaminoacyl peptidase
MTAERWRKIEEVYEAAQARGPDERAAFVAGICNGDEELKRQIDRMLEQDSGGGILDIAAADALPPSAATPMPRQLGPYEIISRIGAGGMGEVWKARDTRLGRMVAIKTLRAEFGGRFRGEARAISALNHPHVCTLYDVGLNYLVMELVEGAPVKGPLPLEKALEYAIQILDGLDSAHRSGIVHRDLKPANILVTKQGIKILDFGLARRADASSSQTGASLDGIVAGTPQYMSPEQIRGEPADARSDIFAFGCMLYEMLAGAKAFPGESAPAVMNAILEQQPRAVSPEAVDLVLKRCLAKDPEERWQTARDLQYALRAIAPHRAAGTLSNTRRRMAFRWPVVALLIAAASGPLGFIYFRERPRAAIPVIRYSIPPPQNTTFAFETLALSPDGRKLAFSAGGRIWLRSLDSPAADPLKGTEGGSAAFWSPDGKSIGFFADSKLKRIDIAGGSPIELANANFRGGTWNSEGVILFTSESYGPIAKIPAAGGPVTRVTRTGGATGNLHVQPWFLPDGRHFLFAGVTGAKMTICAGSLDSDEVRTIVQGDTGAEYAQGHLLFVRGGTLTAQRFNPERLRVEGDAIPVTDQIPVRMPIAPTQFSASVNGMLAYFTGPLGVRSQLAWFDRAGGRIADIGEPVSTTTRIELSPDRRKLAASLHDPVSRNVDIWIFDIGRGFRRRFTFDPANEFDAVWSPDGATIIFSSDRGGIFGLYRKAANGLGAEELLYSSERPAWPMSWSADGKFLLFETTESPGGDLWVLPQPLGPAGASKPYAFLRTQFDEIEAQFSPNGKWVAYQSNESGQWEVYARPFPGFGPAQQISTGGGVRPRWRRDGGEIFYYDAANMVMAADMAERGGALQIGKPHRLFGPAPTDAWYDVSADGRLFLERIPQAENGQAAIMIVQNWPAAYGKM